MYIPNDYTEKISNAYGFCYYRPDGKYAIGYTNKCKHNHKFHYRFVNTERCIEYCEQFLKSLEKRETEKILRTIERNQPHTLQPGDILVSTWGYDQTNVDFYEVLKTTKNTATIEKIGQTVESEAGFMSERVLPNTARRTGKIRRCKVDGRDNYISLTSYSCASKWDGTSVLQSHYA